MAETINNLISSSAFPILTAFLLGLLTIISPCPFCSDITAFGYIGKDISSKATILSNGIFYAIGKIAVYWGLSFVFILGGDIDPVRHFLEEHGERSLGPFFIICAVLILLFSQIEKKHHRCHCGHDHQCHCGSSNECHCGESHHHHSGAFFDKIVGVLPSKSGLGALCIGFIGSLAFCPYTGVLYFGILIPMTLSQPVLWSWTLPLSFALATALPVIIITILFVFGATSVSHLNSLVHKLEVYFRILCVSIFLGVGIYLTASIHSGQHSHEHGHHSIESNR